MYVGDNEAIVKVSDTEIGIPLRIFPISDRFFRVDKARSRRLRNGLGLSITHKIILMHDEIYKLIVNKVEELHFRIFALG